MNAKHLLTLQMCAVSLNKILLSHLTRDAIDEHIRTPINCKCLKSEIQLDSHSPSIRFRCNQLISNNASIADRPRLCPRIDVVEDAFAIRIRVPVQPERQVLHVAALNLIVRKIKIGPTSGNFPSTNTWKRKPI